MAALDDLLTELFDGEQPVFRAEFARWLRGSRRFAAFVTANRGKIRAKLRTVRDDGGMQDLRAELETAALLLREERFTLAYEQYAATRQRGPDFTVTFKTHTPFHVEVRRIRSAELEGTDDGAHTGKLMAVLCDKVGQMPPSSVNLLWLAVMDGIAEADLTYAATALRRLAESKADEYFMRRGFKSATDFLRQYQRLSAIVLRQPHGNVLWLNSLARHRVPPQIAGAIERLETAI